MKATEKRTRNEIKERKIFMKDFKNENEYGNMKTDDEAYEGILLKTGDEGYRYYSSSSSNSSTSSNGYTIGGSYSCSHCLDKGWFSSTSNCCFCDAWQTNLAPISYTYSYEASTDEGMSVCISGVCGNANLMYIYDYTSLNSSPVQSEHASANRIKRTMTFTPGTHYVKIYASSTCGSAEKQFTLQIAGKSYDCSYCNDTGKTNTGVCTHCDACPEDLLRVTWNENDIVALNGTNKAYVPITAEANAGESIYLRIVVEDAETNEAVWRSNDFSTQSFTASNCNLINGTYNVYAVMTVLSNMTERVSEKKELCVTVANVNCAYCNDTGLVGNKTVCTNCTAGEEYIAPLKIAYNYSEQASGYKLDFSAACEDGWNMWLYLYNSDKSTEIYSRGVSAQEVTGTYYPLSEGEYIIEAKAMTSDDYTRTQVETVVITENNTCPAELLQVICNKDDITAVDGSNKANIPITVESNAGEPVWLRIVVEDAETNEECWRSLDVSTDRFTNNQCFLLNGVYKVYAIMTILSSMEERTSEKKELHVTKANDGLITGEYYNFTGLRKEGETWVEYETKVDGYVYKNKVPFRDHIKMFLEPYAGAHYYLQSDYLTTNKRVSAKVDLNDVDESGIYSSTGRNAYISLGLISEGTRIQQCDFGLLNDGYGWTLGTYSKGYARTEKEIEQYRREIQACQNTKFMKEDGIITITLEVTTSREIDAEDEKYIIVGTISSESGKEEKFTYYSNDDVSNSSSDSSGEFFYYQDGEPCLRFMRFMSLVPKADTNLPEDDDRDWSTLKATMYDFTINGEPWTEDKVDYAWSVQGANIRDLKLGGITENGSNDLNKGMCDSIEIYHRYDIHN